MQGEAWCSGCSDARTDRPGVWVGVRDEASCQVQVRCISEPAWSGWVFGVQDGVDCMGDLELG